MTATKCTEAEILNDDSYYEDWSDVLEDTHRFITIAIDACHYK